MSVCVYIHFERMAKMAQKAMGGNGAEPRSSVGERILYILCVCVCVLVCVCVFIYMYRYIYGEDLFGAHGKNGAEGYGWERRRAEIASW